MLVVIYKYSMKQHWSDEHNGIEMDELTKQDIEVTDNEQKWVTQLLKRKNVKKRVTTNCGRAEEGCGSSL
jgi:hypothetical protein